MQSAFNAFKSLKTKVSNLVKPKVNEDRGTEIAACSDDITLENLWHLERWDPNPTLLANFPRDRHTVFCGGFMQELAIPRRLIYFKDMQDVADELGMPTSYIGPPSSKTIDENCQYIFDQLRECYRKHGLKLIIFAHSKAAAEILYLLLLKPELIDPESPECIIDQVVLIQSAIQGSPLAITDENCGGLYKLIELFVKQNLVTRTPEYTENIFNRAFKIYDQYYMDQYLAKFKEYRNLYPDASEVDLAIAEELIKYDCIRLRNTVSSHIHWVRTQVKPHQRKRQSFGSNAILFVIGRSINPNDSLVHVKNQIDLRIGRDCGVLANVDHFGLTLSGIAVKTNANDRRAFMRVIMYWIYRDY
jgi:hypothetical protein